MTDDEFEALARKVRLGGPLHHEEVSMLVEYAAAQRARSRRRLGALLIRLGTWLGGR